MKSDTPKTDAQQEAILWIHDTRRFIVDAEFARTLERELNAERGAYDRAVEKFDCAEALLQTNSVIIARLRAELAQEREWRMSETAASDAMQIRAESAERERDALKLKLEAAKGALANLPLAVSSIGPCSGTKDWNGGYNAAARHAAGVAKLKCEEALSQLNTP